MYCFTAYFNDCPFVLAALSKFCYILLDFFIFHFIVQMMKRHGEITANEIKQAGMCDKSQRPAKIEKFKQNAEARKNELIKKFDNQTEQGTKAMEKLTLTQQKQYMEYWDKVGQY